MTLTGVGSVGAGAAAYVGPGDVVSSATAWWGLRAYSAATAGGAAANVCNPGDAACADLSTSATTGALVITTIGGHDCTANDCTIKKLYDQTVGGHCMGSCDLIQNTEANRPKLVTSCLNSKPCMTSTGTLNVSAAAALAVNQPFTVTSVYIETTHTTFGEVFGSVGGGSFELMAWVGADIISMYDGAATMQAAATTNVWHSITGLANTASSLINVDGVETTGVMNGAAFSTVPALFTGSFGNLIGKITEAGIWSSGFSGGNRTAMNSNMTAYWGPF